MPSFDPNNTGSVSEQQLADNLPKPQGHHGHHHHVAGSDSTDSGNTAQDALMALIQGLGSPSSTSTTGTTAGHDRNRRCSPASQATQNLFSTLDTNGDGSISESELQQGVTQLRSQFLNSLISSQGSPQSQSATA